MSRKSLLFAMISILLWADASMAQTCLFICRDRFINGMVVSNCELRCPSPPDPAIPGDPPVPEPNGPCNADDAFIMVDHFRMSKPFGSSIDNPQKGRWGNYFDIKAEVKFHRNADVEMAIEYTNGSSGTLSVVKRRKPTIQKMMPTFGTIFSEDGTFVCYLKANVVCNGAYRRLPQKIYNVPMVHPGYHYIRGNLPISGPDEMARYLDGHKLNCFTTDYGYQQTWTFRHQVSVGLDLQPVLSLFGLTDETVSFRRSETITIPANELGNIWVVAFDTVWEASKVRYDWLGEISWPNSYRGTFTQKTLGYHFERTELCP